jgi:hypothetical protein
MGSGIESLSEVNIPQGLCVYEIYKYYMNTGENICYDNTYRTKETETNFH